MLLLVKTGDFEAPVAVREKEGERLIEGLTARTPTEGGVGRHTSRRQESDRPEGGPVLLGGRQPTKMTLVYVG